MPHNPDQEHSATEAVDGGDEQVVDDDQVKETQKAILIRLAPQADAGSSNSAAPSSTLWHDPDQQAFASISINGHIENHALRSKPFRSWIIRKFYRATQTVPGSQALEEALRVLSAVAEFDGDEKETHLRLAGMDDRVYIDLADADWRAIEVTAAGWRVVSNPPVAFLRSRGMRPLSYPEHGGSLQDLQELVNLRPNDFKLFMAWLLSTLRPAGPFPILCLNGEQGSCKTTLARMARRLIDPNIADTRTSPKDETDLLVAARNGWIINLDNLSKIKDWLSDALCRIATGGGFGARQLYTNTDEVLFEAKRPIIVNGIPTLATRPDLGDRCFVLILPTMPRHNRITESTFWGRFDDRAGRVLGVLLDCVAQALQGEAAVRAHALEHKIELPRMADAALWVEAAAPALGWKSGEVLSLILENQAEVQKHIADADLVAMAVQLFMKDRDSWEGTSTELLNDLAKVMTDEQRRDREWPKAANSFSNKLRTAAPGIRMTGLGVTENILHGRTIWNLHKTKEEKDPTYPTYPTSNAPAGCDGWDGCDDFGPKSCEPDAEDIEAEQQEREAIQTEPEFDPLEIPPMFDRRASSMAVEST